MSREFGSYHVMGYFHEKLEAAADDAQEGKWMPTQVMQPVLRELSRAAYVAASVEAGDSGGELGDLLRWREQMTRARFAIEDALTALSEER